MEVRDKKTHTKTLKAIVLHVNLPVRIDCDAFIAWRFYYNCFFIFIWFFDHLLIRFYVAFCILVLICTYYLLHFIVSLETCTHNINM